MRNEIRLAVVASLLVASIGCNQQPASQQGATTPEGAPGAASGAGSAAGSAAGPGATAAKPSEPAKPAAPPQPMLMAMDVPAGTPLEITLETPVASDTATAEATVRGTVAKAVVVSGMTAIPAGAPVTGTVVAVERSGRVKGRASIALRFNQVVVANTPYRIQTTRIVRQAAATKGEDATKVGIGAGIGTAIGAIAGGKKGAAIGAGVGAGAGAGAVVATRGDEVSIPAGATLRTTIDESVKITAPM